MCGLATVVQNIFHRNRGKQINTEQVEKLHWTFIEKNEESKDSVKPSKVVNVAKVPTFLKKLSLHTYINYQ